PHQTRQYLFVAAVVTSLASLWVMRNRIGRGPVAAVLIFCCVLAPALGFVNVYPMKYSFVADHFQYAAGMALIALIPSALWHVRFALIPAAALLAILTWRQAHIYQNAETLWRDVIAKNPDSWMAHNNLGALLAQQATDEQNAGNRTHAVAKLEAGVEQFRVVDRLRPQHEILPFNLGEALMRLGKFDEAIEQYRRGIARSRSSPTIARAYDRIGQMLELDGHVIEAQDEYRRAVAADANLAD